MPEAELVVSAYERSLLLHTDSSTVSRFSKGILLTACSRVGVEVRTRGDVSVTLSKRNCLGGVLNEAVPVMFEPVRRRLGPGDARRGVLSLAVGTAVLRK
jgi:hypothetical protein